MIDQAALVVAHDAFIEKSFSHEMTVAEELDALAVAIEAYEAAKWRPVEEMPEDRSKIVIWYGNALYHGEDFAVVRNAMFRTINAPPQK